MNSIWTRRLAGLGALAVTGGALAWLAWGNLGDNLVYYWSPTELLDQRDAAQGSTIRLGGLVVPGTFDPSSCRPGCSFDISDGDHDISVYSTGMPPQMFREGIGVVVEGELQADDSFRTDRIMIKHSNEYQKPDDHPDPAEVYRTLVEEPT